MNAITSADCARASVISQGGWHFVSLICHTISLNFTTFHQYDVHVHNHQWSSHCIVVKICFDNLNAASVSRYLYSANSLTKLSHDIS